MQAHIATCLIYNRQGNGKSRTLCSVKLLSVTRAHTILYLEIIIDVGYQQLYESIAVGKSSA